MSKTFFLKIGLLVFAVLAGVYVLQNQTVTAQKKTTVLKSKSLCESSEQTIWNCRTTKNKIASVCASKDLAEDRGYVQYRFGTPGKIELEFPQNRTDSAQKFKYSRYTRPLVTMLTLSFENNGVVYEIHDDDNEEEKPPIRTAGVDIRIGQKEGHVAVCKMPTVGSLMKLEDIVPRDEER